MDVVPQASFQRKLISRVNRPLDVVIQIFSLYSPMFFFFRHASLARGIHSCLIKLTNAPSGAGVCHQNVPLLKITHGQLITEREAARHGILKLKLNLKLGEKNNQFVLSPV